MQNRSTVRLFFGIAALIGSLLLLGVWFRHHEIEAGVERLERYVFPRNVEH